MRILFCINTAAQAYTWNNIINKLRNEHEVKVLARDSKYTLLILEKLGIQYKSFKSIKIKYLKILEILNQFWSGFKFNRKYKAYHLIA